LGAGKTMNIFLNNINIRNFRTFGDFQLDISAAPGLVIVSGPNGLGKSSFFDAIEWALTSNVRRFGKYLTRGDTEADYLTREGAKAFGHSVGLIFSDGGNVRRVGSEQGATGTSDEDLANILVDPDWTQKIASVPTYLGLTHFLGQGSRQRFMSLEPPDQWETLRAPSGVDRLEQIRKRLRGSAATQAFTRKAEFSKNEVSLKEDELARWDALVERLRRLEILADASSVMSRDDIAKAATELYQRIPLVTPLPITVSKEILESTLIEIRVRLTESLKAIAVEENRLAGLSRLPDQHTALESKRAAVRTSLEGLRKIKRQSELDLKMFDDSVEKVESEQRRQQVHLRRLREQSAFLLAATQDLRDSAEAITQRANLENTILQHKVHADELTHKFERAEAALSDLRKARVDVSSAMDRKNHAVTLHERATTLLDLQEQLAAAVTRRISAESELQKFSQLDAEGMERVAKTDFDARHAELQVRRKRAGAISSALSTIANHLTHEESDCPICKSHFAVGEIKRLAELSAKELDAELLHDEEQAAKAEQELRYASSLKRQAVAAMEESQSAAKSWEVINAAATAMRNALVVDLELPETQENIAQVTAARLIESNNHLDEIRRLRETHESNSEETHQYYIQTREGLEIVRQEINRLQNEIAKVQSDEAAATRRFTIRSGEVALSPAEVPGQLASTLAEIDSTEGKLASVTTLHQAELHKLRIAKLDDASLSEKINEQQLTLSRIEEEISALIAAWSAHAMMLPLHNANLEEKFSELLRLRKDCGSLESERVRLSKALETTANLEELTNVQAVVSNITGGMSTDHYRNSLVAAVNSAKLYSIKIQDARSAVIQLGERLQNEAESYTTNFLAPLNELIGAFNDALLTSPGTSVYFQTDHMANRTQFSARLRRRKSNSNFSEIRPVDPQLILSEGQLAANGFSILCSASVSYRWSKWRCLLLDDPLQHNDIIHAAAFTDVMRNLVELQDYQVFMSSHDRAETEFIERKFTAACLPCTIVHLLADSEEGVTYEVRHNEMAQKLMNNSKQLSLG
jgi:DNA repair exonuclease SbcCD ATPase subunit